MGYESWDTVENVGKLDRVEAEFLKRALGLPLRIPFSRHVTAVRGLALPVQAPSNISFQDQP